MVTRHGRPRRKVTHTSPRHRCDIAVRHLYALRTESWYFTPNWDDRMKRREFITFVGGAAAFPLAARAQQQTIPVIGFLSSRSQHEAAGVVRAFHEGLAETGFSEGRNITIEYRWGEGNYDRLQAMA